MIKNNKLAVIGLGYVGLPLAAAFSKYYNVVGFDINEEKIKLYQSGVDVTEEIGSINLEQSEIEFTSNEDRLDGADYFIIAVPTPIYGDKTPDLNPIVSSSEIVARHIGNNSIVIYESTVYPGLTEKVCIPALEKISNLKEGKNFHVGYSPERINPGDKVHTLSTIKKIVSGSDERTCEKVAKLYEKIIDAGVHKVSSIKVAEAVKVVENSQRDINIAFMNELAMALHKMDIDTKEVVDAMNTKWNALKFSPGLVGGHCISVDPYYFIYEAENLGDYLQLMSAGRRINDGMGEWIANMIIKQLILANQLVSQCNVAIMGITFKENCSDIRNTRIIEIYEKLSEVGINVSICDERADWTNVKERYGIELISIDKIRNQNAIVFAVAHDEYKMISEQDIFQLIEKPKGNRKSVIIDIKNILPPEIKMNQKIKYWSL